MHKNARVSVLSIEGQPLMPTKYYRAQSWVDNGEAEWFSNDLQIKTVRLLRSSGTATQSISVGIDPGKLYSGIGVVSKQFTLFRANLNLPFKRVKARKEAQKLLRRARRGRRINRKVSFHLRAHRQKRFNNRRQKKVAPSIRANRQLELRIVSEICKLFPISSIVYEYVKADVDLTSKRKKARSGKGFSAVMVGQKWAIEQLNKLA
ncbi:MAG: RRXRR domain-containing protein, partial [Alphaproteobacteria bacterium]